VGVWGHPASMRAGRVDVKEYDPKCT
jgi:hypothetical protein